MIFDGQAVLETASRLALALLTVSMALAFIRLVKGPQAADRVVALDLISVLIVAFLAAYAVHSSDTSFLDVAIAYALVAFLGTVALARFLSRSRSPGRRSRPPAPEENQ
jgi:multicomponent Na+:H+ antiporter subunit F